MFCGKCGTKNPDDSLFCVSCGARFGETAPVTDVAAPVRRERTQKKHTMLWLLPVIAVVLAAAALTVFLFLTGRSEKKTAELLMEAYLYGDAESLVELIPDGLYRDAVKEINQFADGETIYDVEDLKNYLEDGFQELLDEVQEDRAWEYGSKWKAVYEIAEMEHITGMELGLLKQEYLEDYDLKITDAAEVEFDISIRGEYDRDDGTETITLVKIGRKWYIDVRELELDASDLADQFLWDVFYALF